MLATYLTWHLRQALAPLTFTDDQKPAREDPVIPNGVALRCCCDNVTVLWLMIVLRDFRLTGGCRT